jgi:hypothetical protein|tara:strand:+ start:200 stop:526 length:327 start_codon:yes stop_codon:yes gene_type:complete
MLETEIKKLTAAIEALTEAMAPSPVTQEPVAAPVTAPVEVPVEVPVADEAMDKDTLTRMCIKLSRDGKKDLIKEKLETYGVTRVTELVGNKNYGAFCGWVIDQSGEIQ